MWKYRSIVRKTMEGYFLSIQLIKCLCRMHWHKLIHSYIIHNKKVLFYTTETKTAYLTFFAVHTHV